MRSAYREAPPAPDATDEAEVVRRLADFHPGAWEELFEREFPRLYKFALVRTGDGPAAEDIAAEVFEEASRRISRYEFRGLPLRAWIYRIARNLTADHLSRRRRRPQVRLEDVADHGYSDLGRLESLADISQALAALTREQQEVIALRYIVGCDLAEAAAAMSKSVGAVKLLQHRALQTLRRQLTHDGEQKS